MTIDTTAYHQLGKFIVWFQHAEGEINEIIVLLSKADCEMMRILINDLEYSKRLNAVDVLFSRFVDLRKGIDKAFKTEFHKLIIDLKKLGERRNDVVHSRYLDWENIDGDKGLIRENSKNRGKQGIREEKEEELLPKAFEADFEKLDSVLELLKKFRSQIIDWRYPDV